MIKLPPFQIHQLPLVWEGLMSNPPFRASSAYVIHVGALLDLHGVNSDIAAGNMHLDEERNALTDLLRDPTVRGARTVAAMSGMNHLRQLVAMWDEDAAAANGEAVARVVITTPTLTTLEKIHERTKVYARRRHVAPYRCESAWNRWGELDSRGYCSTKPLRFADDSCLARVFLVLCHAVSGGPVALGGECCS